jgi:AraC-like DNA-binding protein
MSRSGQPAAVVRTYAMQDREQFTQHTHHRHQLASSAGGVLTLRTGDQTWVLPPSRALWIPAGIPHAVIASGPAVLRTAYLDPARCPLRWGSPTPVLADELLLALMDRLEHADLTRAARRRSEAVLLDVIRAVEVSTVRAPMPADTRAAAVATGLITDPADPRTIEQWGRSVGATGRTLARLFTAETGLTFGQWRTAARISAALHLLASGNSVAGTAPAVGYQTTSAFIAAFARELGCTPAAYYARQPRSE